MMTEENISETIIISLESFILPLLIEMTSAWLMWKFSIEGFEMKLKFLLTDFYDVSEIHK